MKKEVLTETNLNNSKKLSKITEALLDVLFNEPFIFELLCNSTINKIFKDIEKELLKELKNYPALYSEIKKNL